MKQTKEGLGGGFENPSDNWHLFEIAEEIKFSLKKGTEEATNRLTMRFIVIEDETEKGNSTFQGFDLGKAGGREGLAILMGYIKLIDPIEKKYKIVAEAKEMSEQEWGNAYLDITSDNQETRELSQKIVNAFIAKAPGKTFYGLVKSRPGKYKDPDSGQMVDTTYVDIPKMRFTGDEEIKKEIKARLEGKTGKQKPTPAAAASGGGSPDADDDDWPDE